MNFGNLGNQEKGWKLSACCYVNILFFCKKVSKMLIYTKKVNLRNKFTFLCKKVCTIMYIRILLPFLFVNTFLFVLTLSQNREYLHNTNCGMQNSKVENSACYSVKLPRIKKPKSFDRFITNRYLVAAHWTGAKMSIHFIPSTYLSIYVTDLVVRWVD